jgi:hypothetical protein
LIATKIWGLDISTAAEFDGAVTSGGGRKIEGTPIPGQNYSIIFDAGREARKYAVRVHADRDDIQRILDEVNNLPTGRGARFMKTMKRSSQRPPTPLRPLSIPLAVATIIFMGQTSKSSAKTHWHGHQTKAWSFSMAPTSPSHPPPSPT